MRYLEDETAKIFKLLVAVKTEDAARVAAPLDPPTLQRVQHYYGRDQASNPTSSELHNGPLI